MIKLGDVVIILDLHRQGLSISAIARELGIDRKTVRRTIAGGLEPPVYGPRTPRPRRIDPFVSYLRERVTAYPGLTGQRLWRELRERGYAGGYTAVTDLLRELRPTPLPAFEVRFETPPGDQAQVDFAHFQVVFTDEPSVIRIVWLFSFVLGHSRLIWARFVLHQDMQTVLRCHMAAFEAIGGVPREHPLGLMEGATEHSAVVQALIDHLIERGLDPAVPRLFIIDGSKALAKAIRHSFGRHTPIQRCQIHKARNIMECLSPALHASVRRALRQAWELNDAAKAEKLIRNLAQRLERDAPGVSKSLLEGLDEILTVSRLGLPAELRRSLACTNIIENMMGTVRRVTRNVKRWSSSSMALRWTAAAMNEAKKGFRRLKA